MEKHSYQLNYISYASSAELNEEDAKEIAFLEHRLADQQRQTEKLQETIADMK